jgi:hypothetical protein
VAANTCRESFFRKSFLPILSKLKDDTAKERERESNLSYRVGVYALWFFWLKKMNVYCRLQVVEKASTSVDTLLSIHFICFLSSFITTYFD